MKKSLVALLIFFCFSATASATGSPHLESGTVISVMSSAQLTELRQLSRPSPLLQNFWKLKKKDKKVNAALLAFPFPCGIVGLHRIYLGTAPYVPVVYIATLGGCFGILPFIDFCVLLIDRELEPYIRNEKVFMWAN